MASRGIYLFEESASFRLGGIREALRRISENALSGWNLQARNVPGSTRWLILVICPTQRMNLDC